MIVSEQTLRSGNRIESSRKGACDKLSHLLLFINYRQCMDTVSYIVTSSPLPCYAGVMYPNKSPVTSEKGRAKIVNALTLL